MFGIQNGHKHLYIKFCLYHVDIFRLLIVRTYQLVATNTCSRSTCFQIAMNCYHDLQLSVTIPRPIWPCPQGVVRWAHRPRSSWRTAPPNSVCSGCRQRATVTEACRILLYVAQHNTRSASREFGLAIVPHGPRRAVRGSLKQFGNLTSPAYGEFHIINPTEMFIK